MNGQGSLFIGDYTIIGPDVTILTSTHRFKEATKVPYDEVDILKPVSIGRCVWIGIRALILPGVTLSEGCVVGAGAVVTKSFSKGTIIGGNPAKPIGQRDLVSYDRCIEERQFYLMLKYQGKIQKREVIDQEVEETLMEKARLPSNEKNFRNANES